MALIRFEYNNELLYGDLVGETSEYHVVRPIGIPQNESLSINKDSLLDYGEDELHELAREWMEEQGFEPMSLDELLVEESAVMNEQQRLDGELILNRFSSHGVDDFESDVKIKYKMLSSRYDEIEKDVHNALRKAIQDSNQQSKHLQENAITVNVFDYKEMVVINNELTFLDGNGYHYSLYADCDLVDLIDILNQL